MKKYIIIAVIVVVYVLFGVLINSMDSSTYLIINPSVRWQYRSNKWINMDLSKRSLGKFNIYGEDGTYKFKTDNNEIYNGKDLLSKTAIAYKGKISIIDYDINYNVTDTEINEVLSKSNIKKSGYNNASKINLDIDNDGKVESIYSINNVFEIGGLGGNYYSIIVVKDENTYKLISKKTSNEPFTNPYNISLIVDFKNDGIYEIIVDSNGISRDSNNLYTMYGLEKGNYVELVKNK